MKPRNVMIALTSMFLLAAPVAAQDAPPDQAPGGRRGAFRQAQPRLAPEEARAAWTLQARGVASRLELDEATSGKVVEAYLAARASHAEAQTRQRERMRDLRDAPRGDDDGGGGDLVDRRERFRAMRESWQADIEAVRAKLREDLAKVLAAEPLADAARSLGSFNGQWDRLVHVVAGFEAGEEKTMAALAPIEKYVVATTRLRESGDRTPGSGREARAAMAEARDDLHAALSYVLTEPQLEKVLESMRRGRRGPGGDRDRNRIGRNDA